MQKKVFLILSALIAGACLLPFTPRLIDRDVLTSAEASMVNWFHTLPMEVIALMPLYVILAIAVLVCLPVGWRITHALDSIRKLHERECVWEQMTRAEGRRACLAEQLSQPQGWATVASQLIADALQQTVALNVTEAGVMDVSAMPVPRFTVCAVDGRRFTFTVSPGALRQHGLLPRHVSMINLSWPSAMLATDAQLLWDALQRTSKVVSHTAVPRQMNWHLVVTQAERAFAVQKPLLDAKIALPVRVLRTLHLL
jgi:hypothetical protein